MLNKVLDFLKRATLALLIACSIWAIPHIKDGYYRSEVGSHVVQIVSDRGTGSGFHVEASSGDIYILTNAHVCEIADQHGTIKISNGESTIPRKIVAVYPQHDLCLIQKLPKVNSGISLAKYSQLGEDVILIGHPKGRPLTLSKGEIISKTVIQLLNSKVQEKDCSGEFVPPVLFWAGGCVENFSANGISTISFPGNSGSPVVNKYGRLVGVLFAGSDQPTDSYMVPLNAVKNFLKDY